MQDHDARVAFIGLQRPFHVLRLVVEFFQRQGHLRQLAGLGIRQTGTDSCLAFQIGTDDAL